MAIDKSVFVSRFGIADYIVFIGMLMVSAGIGFYYACSGSRQRTAREYLMANRSMGVIPISLSLLASFLSAIGLLGIPAEVYVFGTSYWTIILCFLIVMPVSAHLYLPVFYDLKLTSAYEYLERRFNRTVRFCGSLIFITQMTMYMAMVTYAPALALSQVTGLHVWGSVAAIGIVCTFYTTVGGMKAVMWTDALQIGVMVSAMLAVIIRGSSVLGGFEGVWEVARKGGRIDFFNFDPNPLVRHTFWGLTIGAAITWTAIYGVNQAQVQRYLTAPTKRTAQTALWLNLLGLTVALSICSFTGLVLYARYASCDPVSKEVVTTNDQILPLFVMEIMGDLPGLPGFFVAGIFSGSLSTLSSGLNSLAAVALEDFIKPTCFQNLSEERAGLISKFLALGFGAVSLALVAVAEQLGNILQAALSVFGMIGGPLLGVFTLGMFFPWANSTGAVTGLICSLILVLWIGIGAQIAKPFTPKLPVTTIGCSATGGTVLSLLGAGNSSSSLASFNYTMATVANSTVKAVAASQKDVLGIYKLSYHWYSFVACGTVIIVGLIVSFLTGCPKPEEFDVKLLNPLTRYIISVMPRNLQKALKCNFSSETEIKTRANGVRKTEMNGRDNAAFKDEEKDNAKNEKSDGDLIMKTSPV